MTAENSSTVPTGDEKPLDIEKLKKMVHDESERTTDLLEAALLSGITIIPSKFIPQGQMTMIVHEIEYKKLEKRMKWRAKSAELRAGINGAILRPHSGIKTSEADLANASPEDRAEILANCLHEDKFLEATYTPPTVAKARKLAKERERGRAMLAGQNIGQSRNMPREVGAKVGTAIKENK